LEVREVCNRPIGRKNEEGTPTEAGIEAPKSICQTSEGRRDRTTTN